MLFHVSDRPDIARFEPRRSVYTQDAVVWAISENRLCNYLLPRDCPRVTFYAVPTTTVGDVERLLGSSRVVIAIESGWLERVRAANLYCYRMPPDTFECMDAGAGYYVSRASVVPTGVEVIDDPLGALATRAVELRIMPSLWALRDAVVASTVQFSLIRMGNATPRAAA